VPAPQGETKKLLASAIQSRLNRYVGAIISILFGISLVIIFGPSGEAWRALCVTSVAALATVKFGLAEKTYAALGVAAIGSGFLALALGASASAVATGYAVGNGLLALELAHARSRSFLSANSISITVILFIGLVFAIVIDTDLGRIATILIASLPLIVGLPVIEASLQGQAPEGRWVWALGLILLWLSAVTNSTHAFAADIPGLQGNQMLKNTSMGLSMMGVGLLAVGVWAEVQRLQLGLIPLWAAIVSIGLGYVAGVLGLSQTGNPLAFGAWTSLGGIILVVTTLLTASGFRASYIRSDRRRAELERQQRDALQALNVAKLNDILSHPSQGTTEATLTILSQASGFEVAVYAEPTASGEFRYRKHVGDAPPGYPEILRATDFGPGGLGISGEALEKLQAVLARPYAHHPRSLPKHAAAGVQAWAATPVEARGRVYGVLGLISFKETHDDPRPFLSAASQKLGRAIDDDVQQQELLASREGTLRALGILMEYRDLETKGHTQRVQGLSLQLGLAMGLDPISLSYLELGAYLHDIGKLAIPDRVLSKNGPLDPEERQLVEGHVRVGEHILREAGVFPEAALAVLRCHHESWDGSGYPNRLAGEEIPLLARIFTVVDVYDALIHKRAYKAAWPEDEVLAEIAALAGKRFDPKVVEVFLTLKGKPV
jgi:HD-GYP domain-containing protein (c-di-GMP phosphodiesterase class II)